MGATQNYAEIVTFKDIAMLRSPRKKKIDSENTQPLRECDIKYTRPMRNGIGKHFDPWNGIGKHFDPWNGNGKHFDPWNGKWSNNLFMQKLNSYKTILARIRMARLQNIIKISLGENMTFFIRFLNR